MQLIEQQLTQHPRTLSADQIEECLEWLWEDTNRFRRYDKETVLLEQWYQLIVGTTYTYREFLEEEIITKKPYWQKEGL